jgi:hypothetical protein
MLARSAMKIILCAKILCAIVIIGCIIAGVFAGMEAEKSGKNQ